jgi:hypothetical protein
MVDRTLIEARGIGPPLRLPVVSQLWTFKECGLHGAQTSERSEVGNIVRGGWAYILNVGDRRQGSFEGAG